MANLCSTHRNKGFAPGTPRKRRKWRKLPRQSMVYQKHSFFFPDFCSNNVTVFKLRSAPTPSHSGREHVSRLMCIRTRLSLFQCALWNRFSWLLCTASVDLESRFAMGDHSLLLAALQRSLPAKSLSRAILVAPCTPAEARQWIFLGLFAETCCGKFDGIFSTQQIKAQKFQGKYRSIFRENFRCPNKIFRANFVLQTCHPEFRSAPQVSA